MGSSRPVVAVNLSTYHTNTHKKRGWDYAGALYYMCLIGQSVAAYINHSRTPNNSLAAIPPHPKHKILKFTTIRKFSPTTFEIYSYIMAVSSLMPPKMTKIHTKFLFDSGYQFVIYIFFSPSHEPSFSHYTNYFMFENIYLIAAHDSMPLGRIWLAGKTNPLDPVSLSSAVKLYLILLTSYA